MATLAILGHPTRGKEVIEILKMLGGDNSFNLSGKNGIGIVGYRIGQIIPKIVPIRWENKHKYISFTLEGFLEKFPYKVGDKVCYIPLEYNYTVSGMRWIEGLNEVHYKLSDGGCFEIEAITANDLCYPEQESMEETMEDNIIDTVKESDDRYRIVLNHQFDMEVDEGEYYAVRRNLQYQKTFEECEKILELEDSIIEGCLGYKYKLLNAFQKLLMCRDAYCKIAAEKNKGNIDYVICNVGGKIINTNIPNSAYNHILTFPTEEIRDAFFENFKDLIEECKELL